MLGRLEESGAGQAGGVGICVILLRWRGRVWRGRGSGGVGICAILLRCTSWQAGHLRAGQVEGRLAGNMKLIGDGPPLTCTCRAWLAWRLWHADEQMEAGAAALQEAQQLQDAEGER